MIVWTLAVALASAGEARFGLFIGADRGLAGETPLLFATSDARRIHEVMIAHGGVDEGVLLLDPGRPALARAVEDLTVDVRSARARGDHTTVFVYYSGHGDDRGLHPNGALITYDELHGWLDQVDADVSVVLLDACQSGGAVRSRGGSRGPSLAVDLGVEQVKGRVVLTSSAISELSQESSDVGGGFFTWALHGALLGAADDDADERVTLSEVVRHVSRETAFQTRDTPERQTPIADWDITGPSEPWFTDLRQTTSHLVFDGTLSGTYAVWDDARRRYVAEVEGGRPTRLAVASGDYAIHKRMPGWVEEALVTVDENSEMAVDAGDFASVAFESTRARASLRRQARLASLPDLIVLAELGGRSFGQSNVFADEYIPAHVVGGVGVQVLPARRTGLFWGLDVLTGGGPGTLVFESLGEREVQAGSFSIGADAGFATRPALFRAGVGGRAEVIGFFRRFQEDDLPDQATWTVSPGITGWGGLHHRRLVLDLVLRLHLVPTRWDHQETLPLFGEFLLSGGYRF